MSGDPARSGRAEPLAPSRGLSDHSIRSGTARLAGRGTLVVVGVVSTAVLARLLTPEDFGLVAMVVLLTSLVQSFRHFGLPMAVVHEDDLTDDELDALFRLGARLSGVVFVGMLALAPVLAGLFGESRVIAVTVALAFGKTALGLAAQPMGLLMRRMRFATLAWIEVGASTMGAAAGIGAALAGAGYWALVVQILVSEISEATAWWWASGWRPDLRRVLKGGPADARERVARAVRFAGNHSGASVVSYLTRKVDRVLVGVFAGASMLGLYDLAFKWSWAPMRHLPPALDGVAVAGLSRVRDDAERFRRFCRRSYLPVLAVVLPSLAFLVAEPDSFVRVLLGARWVEAVPLVRLLAVAAFARALTLILPWLYLAEGRTRRQLGWSLVQGPVLVVAAAVGLRWGTVGVAAGVAAATTLLAGPELAWGLRGSRLQARDLVAAAWRPVLASVVAAALLLAVRDALPAAAATPLPALGSAAAVFATAYAGIWLAVPGGVDAARQVASLVRAFRREADPGAGSAGP